MSRLKELGEQRAKIQEEIDGIRAACEKGKRSRTEAEKLKYDELKAKRSALDAEITDEEEEASRQAAEARSKKPAGNPTPEQEQRSEEENVPSIRTQVVNWQKRNKEVIAKIKGGQKAALNDLEPLEIRAANSPMTPANTISDTISINPGAALRQGADIFDLRRVSPTFFDYLPKQKTNLETYPWVNKKVPASSGAAGFIGPGVAKPGVSFTLEVEKSNAKKIAVSLKTATELLDDVDGMVGFIEDELKYQLKIEANTKLMTGVESSTVPAGVQTFSLGFTTSGLSTVNPNEWDCCRAVVAQMRKAFINGPIVIFLNPIDTANMDMSKAVSQGTYLGLNVRQVPGALIVEDYNITAGYLQAIAIDCLKTKIYKDFGMSWGWENDDFTKNLVTVIGEMRLHSFHSENDAAGFVYDDFADIKSQIAAA
jgi:HK97 family phage major capsid protein